MITISGNARHELMEIARIFRSNIVTQAQIGRLFHEKPIQRKNVIAAYIDGQGKK